MTKFFKNTYNWFTDLPKLNQGLVIGGIALFILTLIALIIACVALNKTKTNKKKIKNIVKTNNLKEKSLNK